MSRLLSLLLTVWGCLLTETPAAAHEVRPAYLEIDETTSNRFDVLWKQPSSGSLVLHLEPQISNRLLDSPADETYAADSFLIRRWKGRPASRGSFEGATVSIIGLEQTLTDVLVNIRFLNGRQLETVLTPGTSAVTLH